jgi:hypothetical protein
LCRAGRGNFAHQKRERYADRSGTDASNTQVGQHVCDYLRCNARWPWTIISTAACAARRYNLCEGRIEIDQIKQQHRVDEITDTDYFRELQQKATTLRNQVSGQEET